MKAPAALPQIERLVRHREPGDQPGIIRLNRNERQEPLPDWFVEEIRSAVTSDLFTQYPVADALYEQLSASLELSQDEILLTAGSDAAIKAIFHCYVPPGGSVVMLEPSYAMYGVYTEMFGARRVGIGCNDALEFSAKELSDALEKRPSLLMLANPNQPTGTLLDGKIIRRLLERALELGVLVAIDEAYYPFSGITYLRAIREFPNLVITRTFSKACGLAGLRIGFAVAAAPVIGALYKVRSVHDVNTVALLAALKLSQHPEIVEQYVRHLREGAEIVAQRARELALEVYPSSTNFILIKVGHLVPAASVVDGLLRRGYLVRGPFSQTCLAACIRVTLGPPKLMNDFMNALDATLRDCRNH
ncbi:MAG: histidinol-phosphate aminotransferase family protein [Verrucomicrobia bacterium]|nr:histidinol-phosphate aminotransferase family protein [Verrucomicrobiota bacterium]